MIETDPVTAHLSTNSDKAYNLGNIQKASGSLFSSSFNLANAAIGAGVLAFPFAFSRCGLLLGIIISIVQTLVCGLALHWVAKESARNDHTTYGGSYDQLVTNKLGNVAGIICILAIVGNIFGAMVGFLIIIGDMVEPLGENFIGDEWYGSRTFLSLVLVVFLVFPLSALPRIDMLSYTSTVSILSISLVVFLVIYKSISAMINGTADSSQLNMFVFDWSIFEAIPIITFALTCHVQVPPIYQELKNHSVERFKYVILFTYSMCFILYVSCGSFGYLNFKESTKDNILLNYPSDDPASNVARVCVIITALFSYPIMSFVFRQSMDYVLFNLGYELVLRRHSPLVHPPYLRLFIESTTSLALAWILSVLVPSIGTVFGLIGGTGGALIVFVFPALLELKEVQSIYTKGGLISVIVLGIAVGAVSSVVIILDILENSKLL